MGVVGSSSLSSSEPKPPTVVATCQQWHPIKIDCPAQGCDSEGWNPSYWYHTTCGGSLQINSQALLQCGNCKKPYSILYGCWSCEKHDGEFLKTDKKKLVAAISIASGMVKDFGPSVWVKQLIRSVSELTSN